MKKNYRYPLLIITFLLSSLTFGATPKKISETPISGKTLIKAYYADIYDLERVYIFTHSAEYYQRFSTFYADWLKRLKKVDFKALSQQDQIDFILLKRNIKRDQEELKQSKENWQKIKYTVPFEAAIVNLQRKRRRGKTLNSQHVAAIMHQVIIEVEKAKKAIKNKALPTENLKKIAVQTVRELQKGLKNVYDFYNGYDPSFTWWMKSTYPAVDTALTNYAKWLRRQEVLHPAKAKDGSGINGNPVGKEAIEHELKFQMVPYSPEELVEIAKKRFAWCEAEMIKASQEMGYDKDWKKALEKVKENHLKPGQQPALIAQLEKEAIQLIDSLQLVTIPDLAREAWRMDMLTPRQMQFASYFLGGSKILIAYPHDSQDYKTKEMIMRSGNYSFAHAEVFHELIPGHNLQFYMNRRYRTYRKHFRSPFSTEGWAFYWEMLLWDKGYDNTPEKKIGALYWRMTRCARIIFSLNYHLGKWTPQQCIDYLVDKVGLEEFSAESEVRRSFTGGYGPLYQLAYMVGALQLYSLHRDLVVNGQMTNRAFNDAFLHNGNIPIEMFRAILTHQKLTRNFTTKWRFADYILKN